MPPTIKSQDHVRIVCENLAFQSVQTVVCDRDCEVLVLKSLFAQPMNVNDVQFSTRGGRLLNSGTLRDHHMMGETHVVTIMPRVRAGMRAGSGSSGSSSASDGNWHKARFVFSLGVLFSP